MLSLTKYVINAVKPLNSWKKLKTRKKLKENRQDELEKYKNTIADTTVFQNLKMNIDLRTNENANLILQALRFIKTRSQTDAPDVNFRPKKKIKLSEKTTLGKIDKILRQRKPKTENNFKPTKKTEEAVDYTFPEASDDVVDDCEESEEPNDDYNEPEEEEDDEDIGDDEGDDEGEIVQKNDPDENPEEEDECEDDDEDKEDDDDSDDEESMGLTGLNNILKQKLKNVITESKEPEVSSKKTEIPNYREAYKN